MKLLSTLTLLIISSFALLHAQWIQTNGPFGGGAVTKLISDSSGTIYASTGWSGYFRSEDNGVHWTPVNDGLIWPSGDIAVSPEGVLFASDQQIIRSFNQGDTWEPCDNGLGRIPQSIGINSLGHVYVACNDGTDGEAALFVSDDNGDSWMEIEVPFNTYMESVVVAISPLDHIFIGGPGTLFRSTDFGSTWTDINPMEGSAGIMSLCFDSTDIVYAGSRSGDGLFRSHDNGDQWSHILTEDTWCVAAQGQEVYAATDQGMRRSEDGGLTWDTISEGLPAGKPVYSVIILENNDLLAGSHGAFRSPDNGNHWLFSSDGMISSDVYDLLVSNEGEVYAVSDRLWKTDDDGQNWVSLSDSLDFTVITELEASASGELYLLLDPWFSSLYKSSDDGVNWTELLLPDEGTASVELHPSGDVYVAGNFTGGVFRSSDQGITWEPAGLPNTQIQSMFINTQGVILVCEQNNPATVYRSEDEGFTWVPVHTIEIYGSSGVADYAEDGMGFLYMATYNELLRSDDEGITWQVVNSGMHISSVTANLLDTLYATTYDGIWQSPDQGITWTAFNEGLPSWGFPESVAFSPANGSLYSGWHGQGAWSYGNQDVEVKEPVVATASKNRLSLWPNPTNGTVNVSLDGRTPLLPLYVYSPDGRLITTVKAGADGRADMSGLKKGLYIVSTGEYSTRLIKDR